MSQMIDHISDHRLELHLDITKPVELTDLTLSFMAFGREYRRHLVQTVRGRGGTIKDAEIQLYVTKLETGSIWAELAGASEVLGGLVAVMDYQVIFLDYLNHVRTMMNYFQGVGRSGKVDPKEVPYNKAQCDSIADLCKVASENRDGNLNISSIEYGSHQTEKTKKTNLLITFTSEEATAARRGALISKQALEFRGSAQYENVLMYYYQTNVDEPKSEGRTGDRVVIRTVSENPLPVHFVSEIDKMRIQHYWDDPSFNPFKASYRVDVNVEEDRKGKPRYYRIVNLHEILPDE